MNYQDFINSRIQAKRVLSEIAVAKVNKDLSHLNRLRSKLISQIGATNNIKLYYEAPDKYLHNPYFIAFKKQHPDLLVAVDQAIRDVTRVAPPIFEEETDEEEKEEEELDEELDDLDLPIETPV